MLVLDNRSVGCLFRIMVVSVFLEFFYPFIFSFFDSFFFYFNKSESAVLTTEKHPITCCGKKSSLLQRRPLKTVGIVNNSELELTSQCATGNTADKEACIKTRLDRRLRKSGRAGLMMQKRLIYPIQSVDKTK